MGSKQKQPDGIVGQTSNGSARGCRGRNDESVQVGAQLSPLGQRVGRDRRHSRRCCCDNSGAGRQGVCFNANERVVQNDAGGLGDGAAGGGVRFHTIAAKAGTRLRGSMTLEPSSAVADTLPVGVLVPARMHMGKEAARAGGRMN